MTKLRAFLIIFCGCFSLSHGCSAGLDYTHFLDIHPSFKLCWKFLTATNEIRFRTEVYTSGWFGFGISQDGRMFPADVVMGYMSSGGIPVFNDYYSNSRKVPVLDYIQNWYVVSASNSNNWLQFEFERALNTNDGDDIAIYNGPTNIIWGFSDQKPTSKYDFSIHQSRGSIRLDLTSDTFLVRK